MKLATIVVCLLCLAGWIALASATPFMQEFHQKVKEGFSKVTGGDSNPFHEYMENMESVFKSKEFDPASLRNMFEKGIETATGPASEQMQKCKEKLEEMIKNNAPKQMFEDFVTQMKSFQPSPSQPSPCS